MNSLLGRVSHLWTQPDNIRRRMIVLRGSLCKFYQRGIKCKLWHQQLNNNHSDMGEVLEMLRDKGNLLGKLCKQ